MCAEETSRAVITIKKCPVCGEEHKYSVQVSDASNVVLAKGVEVASLRLDDQKRSSSRERVAEYTRIFSCPKTERKFQATFKLRSPAAEVVMDDIEVDVESEE